MASDPSDKYVGTWATVCGGPYFLSASPTIIRSSRSRVTIAKVSALSYSLDGGSLDYVGAGCPGIAESVVGETISTFFTLVGTKLVAGRTVDKVTYATSATTTANDIAIVDGVNLQRGNSSLMDTDGFPAALYPDLYIKQ